MAAEHAALPQRLVSLVPSTTESVCAFGAGDRLVGCTRYCTHPPAALAGLARIGGTKNPDRERVMSLQPDLVLANAEENRPEDLDWFAARVPVLVQTPRTVAEAVAALRELALAVGDSGAALAAVDRTVAALAATNVTDASSSPRVYYAIWRKPWMTVGGDTFVHDVLRCCGATNVAADAEGRYPEMAPDAAVSRGVDVVLLASEPWEFDDAQLRELGAAATFGRARLVLCDGRDFSWHGTHMAVGLRRAHALLRHVGSDGESAHDLRA